MKTINHNSQGEKVNSITKFQGSSILFKRTLPLSLKQTRLLLILLGVLAFLFAIYQISYQFGDENIQSWVNKIFPMVFLFSLFFSAYILIKEQPPMIFSPLFWFFVACALYFGFGPLTYHYGHPISIWFMEQYYYVSESDLLRTNLLNTLGVGIVIIGFMIGSKFFKSPYPRAITLPDFTSLKKIVITFLLIGLPIKYLLYLPYVFGLTDFILPGSIMQLQILVSLSTIPMILMIEKGAKRWFPLLILLIGSELLTSLLEFGKLSLIIALMLPMLGLFIARRKIYILFISLILLVGMYYFIYPIANYGRSELTKIHGIFSRGSLQERYEIVKNYLFEGSGRHHGSLPGHQFWWTRLCYANAQTFAMTRYDSGLIGTTFSSAIYTVIPRFLWKDKPVISAVGNEFNYLVTRNPDSASAPGVFAEAYWNGGWILVIFTCLYLGFLFAGFTKYSLTKIVTNKFYLLPVMLIGIKMGIRPDGWFVVEYVGSVMVAIFLHLVLKATLYRFRIKNKTWI